MNCISPEEGSGTVNKESEGDTGRESIVCSKINSMLLKINTLLHEVRYAVYSIQYLPKIIFCVYFSDYYFNLGFFQLKVLKIKLKEKNVLLSFLQEYLGITYIS